MTATEPSSISSMPMGLSSVAPFAALMCKPSCSSAALNADIGSSKVINPSSTPSARREMVMPLLVNESSLRSDAGSINPFSIVIQCASISPKISVSTATDAAFDTAFLSCNQALLRVAATDRLVYFQSSCRVVGKPFVAKLATAALRTADNSSGGSAVTAASSKSCCSAVTLMRWQPPGPTRSRAPQAPTPAICRPNGQSCPATIRARSRALHSPAGAGSV